MERRMEQQYCKPCVFLRMKKKRRFLQDQVNLFRNISPFFQFPYDIRRIMYTANIIEGLNQLTTLYGERPTEHL